MARFNSMMDKPLMRSPREATSLDDVDILDDEDSMFADGDQTIEVEIEGEESNEDVETPNMEGSQEHGANLADFVDKSVLNSLGDKIVSWVDEDKSAREEWEQEYTKGLKLLGLSYENRTEPFEGASGVTHPMLNEACMQFSSMAYKELIPSAGPVNTKIIGKTNQQKEEQASRVKNFLNWQLMDQMEEFEPEYDQMLYYVGLAGSTFKKTYIDPELERPVSRFVMAEHFVVPYSATDLDTTPRATEIIAMTKQRVMKLQLSGFYSDEATLSSGADLSDEVEDIKDSIQGKQKVSVVIDDDNEDLTLYESYCYVDLEGFEDKNEEGEATGIALPYIVTVCQNSGEILGIRRNWDEDDPKKKQKKWFTHYKFTPGLGFYGFGLIHLIGGLAHGATANLRQLLDAGTLANLPSGFKAKGIRVDNKDGALAPGEWRDVDAPGGSLRDALMPLPYKEPSGTLFQLLGFIVAASEKFTGTTDLGLSGNQEMPVGTTVALLERGSRIISSVHKRLHSSFKKELKLLAALFGKIQKEYPYEPSTGTPDLFANDFSPAVDIIPVSDPNIFSMSQRIMLAQEQLKMAQSAPEMHNTREAYRRVYSALGVDNIDELMPPQEDPKPVSAALENSRVPLIINGGADPLKAHESQSHDLHIKIHMLYMSSPIVKKQPILYAMVVQHIYEHIAVWSEKLVLEAVEQENPEWKIQSEEAGKQKQNPPPPPIPPEELERRVAQKNIKLLQWFKEIEKKVLGDKIGAGDDLVELKAQEIENVAEDKRAKNVLQQKEIDANKQEHSVEMKLSYDKIASTEGIADDRNRIARQKSTQD